MVKQERWSEVKDKGSILWEVRVPTQPKPISHVSEYLNEVHAGNEFIYIK